jgi:hypothetical protein
LNAISRIAVLSIILAFCMAPVQPASADPAVLFVAPTSQGAGDCSSWVNACGLVSALDEAPSGAEIWVRERVYKPTSNPAARSASFSLVKGVAVYGGFAGDNAALPSAVTVDLGGNPGYTDIPTVTDTGSGSPPLIDLGAFKAYPDAIPPQVVSVTRLDTSPSFDCLIDFLVTFSEAVEGIDEGDFFLSLTGELVPQPIINTQDAGDHIHFIITVTTGTGSGTMQLNVHQDSDVEDLASNLLSGLPYAYGEIYEIRISKIFLPVIVR